MPEQRKGTGPGSSATATRATSDSTQPGAGQSLTEGGGDSLLQQVRSSAGEVLDNAKSTTAAKIDEQKSAISSGLSSVAENIRQLGESAGTDDAADPVARFTSNYSGAAAEKIESAARYFESHDLEAIYSDLESVARRNPAMVVGGAFALGFLAARFLKSSGSNASKALTSANGRSGNGKATTGNASRTAPKGTSEANRSARGQAGA